MDGPQAGADAAVVITLGGQHHKASHDQWALTRRRQAAHIHSLEAGIAVIGHRLSQPIGAKGSKKAPGGYRNK
ncbi:hypothetical protein [Nonomuraea aurantiaca]|uniref:hypothetical protein n=1 Tax=Nonomuraea aurantiaca TaxID=2878562 RepID=UPI001CD95236|nr:hypothetical protein [Nonomuraea aurantiaca]MCA2226156.1 hypothetical protein [Nonomuraea aurantiaca]